MICGCCGEPTAVLMTNGDKNWCPDCVKRYGNTEITSLSQEAYEHIVGSGMSPERLAEIYGITKRLVDQIQMGTVGYPEAARLARIGKSL